jgi:hypothetical protein
VACGQKWWCMCDRHNVWCLPVCGKHNMPALPPSRQEVVAARPFGYCRPLLLLQHLVLEQLQRLHILKLRLLRLVPNAVPEVTPAAATATPGAGVQSLCCLKLWLLRPEMQHPPSMLLLLVRLVLVVVVVPGLPS